MEHCEDCGAYVGYCGCRRTHMDDYRNDLIKRSRVPKLDAVIADTVAKIKAVPTRGPFPAKRKRS